MTQEHSHTPSPARVKKWGAMLEYCEDTDVFSDIARWGADQELEACCEWLNYEDRGFWGCKLRTARRPKPPSLKEQALQALEAADGADHPVVATVLTADQHALIRTALESLPE
jgi:hypothetical protein